MARPASRSVELPVPTLPESQLRGASSTAADAQGRARAIAAVTLAAFLSPVILYFWFIHNYGVNWLHADQWYDIKLIRSWFSGHLTLGELWAQHAENRIFFQNLLTLLLARTTHFNVVDEEYLGAAMLVGATALLILAHRRRSISVPWLAYCPVAFVMLSIAQWGCALYGFELGWFMVMLALASSLYLLDRSELTRSVMAGAVVAAVVGSFSSLQGLFI